MPANLENSAVATGLENVSFHSNAKECLNYHTIVLILHASKIMLKILQAMLQQYLNWELQDVQPGFRKGRQIRDQIANIHWITDKTRECKKKSTPASLTTLKPLTVWIITNCGKLLKRWEYQTILPVSWETWIRVKKQQLEPYMEQLTGSKLRKEYDKAVYCHPVYLAYRQRISCEMLGWVKHRWESR